MDLFHPFDLEIRNEALDLFAEELPEQTQLASDCLASGSSFSCPIASFSTIGSIVSTGKFN